MLCERWPTKQAMVSQAYQGESSCDGCQIQWNTNKEKNMVQFWLDSSTFNHQIVNENHKLSLAGGMPTGCRCPGCQIPSLCHCTLTDYLNSRFRYDGIMKSTGGSLKTGRKKIPCSRSSTRVTLTTKLE